MEEPLPELEPNAWLFPSEKLTTPFSRENCWQRNLGPRLKASGLGWVNFQVMRRTHSSLMWELEVDPKVTADQLGHSVDVNQNVYTQANLNRRLEAVRRLETPVWPPKRLNGLQTDYGFPELAVSCRKHGAGDGDRTRDIQLGKLSSRASTTAAQLQAEAAAQHFRVNQTCVCRVVGNVRLRSPAPERADALPTAPPFSVDLGDRCARCESEFIPCELSDIWPTWRSVGRKTEPPRGVCFQTDEGRLRRRFRPLSSSETFGLSRVGSRPSGRRSPEGPM